MNPAPTDQALDSFINVDVGWIQQFYSGQAKPPDPSRSSSNMEMESINKINTAQNRSRMITAPAINIGEICSWDKAAGTMGCCKPGPDMCPNAVSLINSWEAMADPWSSCFIIRNVPASVNTSALHKHSSGLPGGPPAAEAVGGLSSWADAVKVKKKRARPSRRAPTTVVKTDSSNFKAMVQRLTGIPSICTVTTQESTGAPSASSSSFPSFPESSSSASSPSFSKPLPHPVLCKISNSSPASLNTMPSEAISSCPSPLLLSSFPSCRSLPELPFIAGCDYIPTQMIQKNWPYLSLTHLSLMNCGAKC